MPHRLHHAADLSIFPLSERDEKASRVVSTNVRGERPNTIEDIHPSGESCELRVFDASVHRHEVFFFVLVSRMHEKIRKASVIRQQDESRRILVETPYGKNALRNVDNVEYRFFSFLCACRHDTARFMQHIVDKIFLFLDDHVVHLHRVDLRIYHLSDMGDFTIDAYEPGGDILLRFSAGGDTRVGEVFMQTEFWHAYLRIIR